MKYLVVLTVVLLVHINSHALKAEVKIVYSDGETKDFVFFNDPQNKFPTINVKLDNVLCMGEFRLLEPQNLFTVSCIARKKKEIIFEVVATAICEDPSVPSFLKLINHQDKKKPQTVLSIDCKK